MDQDGIEFLAMSNCPHDATFVLAHTFRDGFLLQITIATCGLLQGVAIRASSEDMDDTQEKMETRDQMIGPRPDLSRCFKARVGLCIEFEAWLRGC